MDQNIGRILQALEQQGVAKSTLIMFLSDNGGCSEEPGGRNTAAIPGQREFYTAVGPAWSWAQNTPFRRYNWTAHLTGSGVFFGQATSHNHSGLAEKDSRPLRRQPKVRCPNKSWVHEGGISTPFIARWPGVVKPAR